MTNDMTMKNGQTAATAVKQDRKVFLPAVNIYETEDKIVLLVDMPGVDEKNVDITLERDVLTIQGRSVIEEPRGMEPAYLEYTTGDYRRSFTLSDGQVNRDGIEAAMKNAVLQVTLPKAETVKPKKISVKAE